jgi:hypothetical protein
MEKARAIEPPASRRARDRPAIRVRGPALEEIAGLARFDRGESLSA